MKSKVYRVRYGYLQDAIRDFPSYKEAYKYAYGNSIRAKTATMEIVYV